MSYKLFGMPGSGSACIELALDVCGAKYDLINEDSSKWSEEMLKLNPMKQVPTLVMPDGEAMTESAAMLMVLGDLYPGKLLPAAGTPERAQAYRWLVYMSANLYEAIVRYYYSARFGEETSVKVTATKRIPELLSVIETQAFKHSGFVVGKERTAADYYLTMLTEWVDKQDVQKFPKIMALRRKVQEEPAVKKVWAAHSAGGTDHKMFNFII